MASSSLSDVCVVNMEEEINSTKEEAECPAAENGDESKCEDATKPEPETEDIFKKPALFVAAALTSKRSSTAAPSGPTPEAQTLTEDDKAEAVCTTTEESPSPANGSSVADRSQDENKDDSQDSNVVPVKTKAEAKPRVLPLKAPPAGKFPPIPYTEPPWGGKAPDTPYALEILKNGAIVDTVPLTQRSYFVVGRLPVCDVTLEHPSISRYHAVIQYRRQAGDGHSVGEETGFYIHDLGSTHGTVVNKNKIPPKTYIRLRVGHVVKFGGSTRLFVLQVMCRYIRLEAK